MTKEADETRLADIRARMAGPKWDDAAGETTTDFLLRLLDEARAPRVTVQSVRTVRLQPARFPQEGEDEADRDGERYERSLDRPWGDA